MALQPSYSVPLEQGTPDRIVESDPGPNNPITIIASLVINKRFNLTGMTFIFNTGIAGSDRVFTITYPNTVLDPLVWTLDFAQAPITSLTYFLQVGESPTVRTIGTEVFGPLPQNIIMNPPGFLPTFSMSNITGNDEFTDIQFFGRSWVQRTQVPT